MKVAQSHISLLSLFAAARKKDVEEIRREHPHKVPIIIERFENEKYLPLMDRAKFLVPDHLTMAELMAVVRLEVKFISNFKLFSLSGAVSICTPSRHFSFSSTRRASCRIAPLLGCVFLLFKIRNTFRS